MITGDVDENIVPSISVRVGDRTWRAVIDTGFNSDLELPTALREQVHAHYGGQVESELAAGQSIIEDWYLVQFPFDGRTVSALATFSDGEEILIGTRLLRRHRLEIDFPAQTVLIERKN